MVSKLDEISNRTLIDGVLMLTSYLINQPTAPTSPWLGGRVGPGQSFELSGDTDNRQSGVEEQTGNYISVR